MARAREAMPTTNSADGLQFSNQGTWGAVNLQSKAEQLASAGLSRGSESLLYTAVSFPTRQIRKDSKSGKRPKAGTGGVQGTEQEREGWVQDSITSGLTGVCLVCSALQKGDQAVRFL